VYKNGSGLSFPSGRVLSTNSPMFRDMKKLEILICSFLFLFAATSCLHDDLSDCHEQVYLKMTYTLNADYIDKFSRSVEEVAVFIYDADEVFVKKEEARVSELIHSNTLPLNLPAGEYTAIVWGNALTDDYEISGTESLSILRLKLLTQGNQPLHTDLPHLFHGIIDFEVTREKEQEVTVDLIKNTNSIRIVLQGIYETRSAPNSDYAVRITGSNGIYRYDNTKEEAQSSLQYIPTYTTSEGVSVWADFTVLRLVRDDDLRVQVTEKGDSKIYELLTERLFRSAYVTTDEDLDRYDNFTLTYTFYEELDEFFLTAIKVEDWEMKIDPGINI